MVRVSVLILGFDPVGTALARRLQEEHPTARIGICGPPPDDADFDNLRRLATRLEENPAGPDGPTGAADAASLRVAHDGEGIWSGGAPFALRRAGDGFVVRTTPSESGRERAYAGQLVVTAPPMLDLLGERALRLPGSDSAAAGLAAAAGVSLEPSTELYRCDLDGSPRVWGMDFGLACGPDGRTSRPGIFAAGAAAAGPPERVDPDRLRGALSPGDPPRDPPPEEGEPLQEDLAMPEGFVDTKLDRLRQLLSRVLASPDGDADAGLAQTLEGIAGEIDSYARFRGQPRLQRLRWKTLTAMTFVRPFLIRRRGRVSS